METVFYTEHKKLIPSVELVWMAGQDRGKRFTVLAGRQTFGRSQDNDIILQDPTVSDRHGVLVYTKEGEVLFYDTASKNGISLNGKKATLINLSHGQQIQIGSVYLKLVGVGEAIDVSPQKRQKVQFRFRIKSLIAGMGLVFLFAFLIGRGRLFSSPATSSVSDHPPVAFQPAHAVRRRAPRVVREAPPRNEKVTGLMKGGQLADQGKTAFEGGRFPEAYGFWKEALSLDPTNQTAEEGLKRLEGVAAKFYEEALMVKGSPEFQGKLKVILAISDPASEIHARAAELMGASAT